MGLAREPDTLDSEGDTPDLREEEECWLCKEVMLEDFWWVGFVTGIWLEVMGPFLLLRTLFGDRDDL